MTGLLMASGLLGLTGVALGAFGAHGLADRLQGPAQGWWDTATLYLLVHAATATAIALSSRTSFAVSGWGFVIGACIFSGSLYAMALGAPRILGAITPIGGLGFLFGWLSLVYVAWRQSA